MATLFYKIRRNGVTSLHAENGERHLMVIPQQEEKVKGRLILGDKDFYPEMHSDVKETITENEFISVAGEITGAIKNFLDKVREGE